MYFLLMYFRSRTFAHIISAHGFYSHSPYFFLRRSTVEQPPFVTCSTTKKTLTSLSRLSYARVAVASVISKNRSVRTATWSASSMAKWNRTTPFSCISTSACSPNGPMKIALCRLRPKAPPTPTWTEEIWQITHKQRIVEKIPCRFAMKNKNTKKIRTIGIYYCSIWRCKTIELNKTDKKLFLFRKSMFSHHFCRWFHWHDARSYVENLSSQGNVQALS